MPRCPYHPEVSLEAKKKGWYCDECGRNVLPYEYESLAQSVPTTGGTDTSIGLDLERLPSIIAIPMAEYCHETHPVLRLWHLCDTVELTLRLLVSIGIADLRRANRGDLPDKLRAEIAARIEEPTVGKWRGMAGALARRLPRDSALTELRHFVTMTLEPLLDGSERDATVETSVSKLRNHLAHGGGVKQAVATRLLTSGGGACAGMLPR